jgi:hypothetical protein
MYGAECKNASLSLAVRVLGCSAGVLLFFFFLQGCFGSTGALRFLSRARGLSLALCDVNARVCMYS